MPKPEKSKQKKNTNFIENKIPLIKLVHIKKWFCINIYVVPNRSDRFRVGSPPVQEVVEANKARSRQRVKSGEKYGFGRSEEVLGEKQSGKCFHNRFNAFEVLRDLHSSRSPCRCCWTWSRDLLHESPFSFTG